MRRFSVGIALAIAIISLTGCGGAGRASAELESYQPGPGTSQITVTYGAGPNVRQPEAEVLSQAADQVRVRVTYKPSEGKHDSILSRLTVVVDLAEPIGDRRVVDEDGTEIPRR